MCIRDSCVVMWNHVRKKPPTDAVAFSEAELESREEIHRIFHYIKENVPMFKDVELIAIAPQTGVRESRHIHGLYTLETDECVNGAQFEDGICDVAFSMDLHLPDRDEQDNIHLKAPYQIPDVYKRQLLSFWPKAGRSSGEREPIVRESSVSFPFLPIYFTLSSSRILG